MKAEQKARKQEQNGPGRQRKHEVDSKIEEALSVWGHEKTTLIECNVLKFSTVGRSPPSSVGRAQALTLWSWARAPLGVAAEPTQDSAL